MPTTYAHDAFGKFIYQKLPEEMKKMLMEQKTAYLIGLHGPDILFYYKPFGKNEVNQKGNTMHQEVAAEFFALCKEKYKESKSEVMLAYVLGFICHYMLDSTCHPYIGTYMEKTGAPHDEIETELDRFLMEHNNRNPFRYHPSDSIHIEKDVVKEITDLLGGVSEKEIKHCLKSMKFYTNIMVCSNSLKRKALLCLLQMTGAYDSMQGHIMRKKVSRRCEESTQELYRLFKLAIPETVTVLEEFYRTLLDEEYLNYRFDRNYE